MDEVARRELVKAIFELPVEERAALASGLIASIGIEDATDVDRAWSAEIERRLQDFVAGRTTATPWVEVRRRMYRW